MNNEELVRKLIQGTIQRAVQESIAAVVVVIAFTILLQHSEAGSTQFYGCLLTLVGTGFIAGVVWSYALSYRLLRRHPASETSFWREAFHVQARLLRFVPYWYCAPVGLGGLLFIAPSSAHEVLPFFLVAGVFAIVIAGVTWLNRRAAACLDNQASLLAD